MSNVDSVSIKIDMPTSQYGTLELNGRLYNVHVENLETYTIMGNSSGGMDVMMQVTFYGQEVKIHAPSWEDSYETP